jgi:hypothetical protein
MKMFSQGKTIEPTSHDVYAVYDPKTGRIMHMHEIVRWPDAFAAPQSDPLGRAFEMAARLGHEVAELKAIRFDAAAFSAGKRYKIDPESSTLVETGEIPSHKWQRRRGAS